jgi:large subunit ribosomal protein L29
MATVSAGADMRELGDQELVSRLRESKEELFNLKFQLATGQLDNNRRVQTVRRDIARIYTVMRERELGITYAAITSEASTTAAADSGENA